MAEIKPFKALIYNKRKIKNSTSIMAPPYDVISSRDRNSYYKANRYNVIRLILGKIYAGDSEGNNRYSRAADFLKEWQKKGILIRDERPCIYVYLQNYYDKQRKRRIDRIGFISLFKLQEFGKKAIYPHEWTLSKPKADRFKLIKATSCNYSPVFSLYYDKNYQIDKILKRAAKVKPLLKATDKDKTVHCIYRITDPKKILKIKTKMRSKRIFIADGHHRYETALNYRTYLKNHKIKNKKINNQDTMMYFTNLNNKGLKIYPIHRLVVNISAKRIDKLPDNLKRYFNLKEVKNKERMLKEVSFGKRQDYKYGLYLNKKFYLLTLKDRGIIRKISKNKKPSHVDRLNVTLLHELIIEDILKADKEGDVIYLKDPQAVIEKVNKKKKRVGFFLSAITSDEIIKAALQNERLPRKSTYFYPKLYSGLVINKLKSD